MRIEYHKHGELKEIKINPDNESLTIKASKREFVQIWLENKINGEANIVSGYTGVDVRGYMANGRKLTKSTCRVS